MNQFFDLADTVLGLAIMAGIPAYLLLQVWTASRLHSFWRIAALLPLGLAVALIVGCIATLTGAVRLGPLPFLFFAPAAALYLLGVVGVRTVASHPA
jgi:hypothetical protein